MNNKNIMTCFILVVIILSISLKVDAATATNKDTMYSRLKSIYNEDITQNKKLEGFKGVWYCCGRTPGEYIYKYSGGLGTYCAKHRPFVVYSKEADKTFFCYGGARDDTERELVHCVSYFDHKTKQVARPTLLLDKDTRDAHDNPVISIDDKGYIWIFSTSHGTDRPSYIHKSANPYDIDKFILIDPKIDTKDGVMPFYNFSYFQVWNVGDRGFTCFMTLYNQPVHRAIYTTTTADGINWTRPLCIAQMGKGSYQVSFANKSKCGTAFNYHPLDVGIANRTNIYYVESNNSDRWKNVKGDVLELPLKEPQNLALVYDAQGKNIYVKDLIFDEDGNPVILVVESGGWQCGLDNDPRTWLLVRWDGTKWISSKCFTSDNNYDTGSIIIENDKWYIVAPTATGPQSYNPGGEMMMWESVNKGETWNLKRQLTVNSSKNHNYARASVNANPDFYALWADGNGRKISDSNLYFSDREGNVYKLPEHMESDMQSPVRVK